MRTIQKQSGFALLLVMILLAMLVVMGISFASSAAIANVAASHHGQMVKAQYLAESGAAHAMFLLREHPETLTGSDATPLGPFSLAGAAGEYTIAVTETGEPGQYQITSEGASGVSTQQRRLLVHRSAGAGGACIEQGVLVGQGMSFTPPGLRVNGPMHVNGHLLNFGTINGSASATGSVINGGVINGARRPGADEVETPEFDPVDYVNYLYNGQVGEAVQWDDWRLQRDDEINLGGAVTVRNPAGVVQVAPVKFPLVIADNVNFRGTLVVEGDVVLYGRSINLDAEDGFPAIIATGAVYVYANAQANVKGVLYAREGVWPYGDSTGSRLNVDGAVICGSGGFGMTLAGDVNVNYDSQRAQLIDPTGRSGSSEPIRILRWQE